MSEAVINQSMALPPTLPTVFILPSLAMPTTSVENTNGAIIICTILKKIVKKPLAGLLAEGQETGSHSLKKTLGPGGLVALGIGAIIGAGLFSITGGAAANQAGPAIVISFIVAAFGCAFAGLCYAEFASMIPVAGSAY